MSRLDNRTGWGAKGHWSRGRGQKFRVPLGRKSDYGYNAGNRDTDSDGYKQAWMRLRSWPWLEASLKPYWGKPTVRNFRGGRGNEVNGLMTFCHATRKGGYIGSHWPNHVRASALLGGLNRRF